MSPKAYLVLADGTTYEGVSIGCEGTVIAEMVFTTAMTGYMETLTDPSYYGQIVLQTFPLIGNYGVISEDTEAAHPALKGYVVKDLCTAPSNFRSEGPLQDFLLKENIVALSGIDTRALTKRLREKGVMPAVLTTKKEDANISLLEKELNKDAIMRVTTQEVVTHSGPGKRVVLWDFGAKQNICRELLRRDAHVIQVPANTSAEDILALNPDGIMLSNGPGNPEDVPEIIENIKKLLPQGIPIFGICMGHQLLALAHGFRTYKLKYGHRGANQPVHHHKSGLTYITSQNHGYAVDADSIDPALAEESFRSSNDGVCEGIDYKTTPTFSAQFHPEACAGPEDTRSLFNRFFALMEEKSCH